MEMPKVRKCEVADCAYNMDSTCHAMAITVGDGMRPRCDTFCQSVMKGGDAGFSVAFPGPVQITSLKGTQLVVHMIQ